MEWANYTMPTRLGKTYSLSLLTRINFYQLEILNKLNFLCLLTDGFCKPMRNINWTSTCAQNVFGSFPRGAVITFSCEKWNFRYQITTTCLILGRWTYPWPQYLGKDSW